MRASSPAAARCGDPHAPRPRAAAGARCGDRGGADDARARARPRARRRRRARAAAVEVRRARRRARPDAPPLAAAASWSTLVRAAWRRWTATAAMRLREARLTRWRLRGQLLLGLRGWARRGRLLAARRASTRSPSAAGAACRCPARGRAPPRRLPRARRRRRRAASARRMLALAAPLAQLRTLALARALGDWRSALPLLALRERCATIEDGLRALRPPSPPSRPSAASATRTRRSRPRSRRRTTSGRRCPRRRRRRRSARRRRRSRSRRRAAARGACWSGCTGCSPSTRMRRVGPALRGWAYLCLRSRHAPQSPALTARAWV